MQISVVGKQLDVGDALRSHAVQVLGELVGKYFDSALDCQVVLSRQAHLFRADISVHAGRGIDLQGGAEGGNAYGAFDGALERVAKQLRRYKRRLRDHHRAGALETLPIETVPAQAYIIAGESEAADEEAPAQPVIIAEMPTEIATLTVGEAVMRLDLGDLPVLMFRNGAHGALNVIYRRPDGNIGWIDSKDLGQ